MTEGRSDQQNPLGSALVKEDASFADIVVEFVEGLRQRVTAMEEALLAADFEALRVAAHQLKGSGGGYGYPMLSEHAARLEQEAKERAIDDCRTCFDQLRQLCERIVVSTEEPGTPRTSPGENV